MRARYKQRKDGEGWSVRSGELFRMACCDCGLVHDMVLVAGRRSIVGIAAKRNNRATAQIRRKA